MARRYFDAMGTEVTAYVAQLEAQLAKLQAEQPKAVAEAPTENVLKIKKK